MSEGEMTFTAFESRYRDKQYIGSGGFAKVFKVFDHANNRFVALKVADVRPEYKQFTLQREVELVNNLPEHPNIARYDACYRFNTPLGEHDFAILKFYEDGNLELFLKTHEITDEDKRLIIRGVLEGVKFLHGNHIIHRDLKAQNILIHRDDGVWTPKITDFGLSRRIENDITLTNSSIGISYAYAAPEQIKNEKIYRNVDLWATGVIIYRVIADELPFKSQKGDDDKSAKVQLELSNKIVNLELPEKLDSLPEPFQSMIRKCLVLDPGARAQSADELIGMLDAPVGPPQSVPLAPAAIGLDYTLPDTNKTIVFPGRPSGESTAEITGQVVMGEPRHWVGWLWSAIAILLIAGGIGIWCSNPPQKTVQPTEPSSKGKMDIPNFDLYRDKILQAYESGESWNAIELELNKLIDEYPSAYQPMYFLSMFRLLENKHNQAFRRLADAASLAIEEGKAGEMELSLKGEDLTVFELLQETHSTELAAILDALRGKDKSLLIFE